MKRERTKYLGVYTRKSESKRHNGKSDVCYDITYKIEGKKIWEKVGWSRDGYSARAASQIRAERIRNIRHGEELPQQKQKVPLFKDIAEKYLSWADNNKARGRQDDDCQYRNYLSSRFDKKRLDEISAFDLEKLKADLTKKGLSPKSVKHCLATFRQIFNKAILWDMYEGQNPIKGVKMPTPNNQRQRFLSHDEADLLLQALAEKSTQLHDMALLSLHCGLRAGEIFNLKGQDLDFSNDLLNISDPKNRESRQAYMTNDVKTILQNRIPSGPNEYVFKDKQGRKITAISRSFQRVVKDLKLNEGITDRRQQITFHSLRHTFASWLALQGETLLTIKELLGHKKLDMTTKYAHLIPDHKRRATLDLEKAFNTNRNLNVINKE